MNNLLIAVASWLHLLATVVFIGFYVLSSLVIGPAAAQSGARTRGSLTIALYERARPFVVGALLVFIVTGAYLTLVSPQYTGLMRFDNTWSWLIVIKHVVVVLLVVVGIYLQRVPVERIASALKAGDERVLVVIAGRVRSLELAAAALGAIILLLTALAAASVG